MHEKSFRIYLFRLLKTLKEPHIGKPAIEACDSIMRAIAHTLAEKALFLTGSGDKKTISVEELRAAVELVIPSSLGDSALSFASQAVMLFEETKEEETKEENKQRSTRESKAGLIFSVSVAEKYLRRFGQSSYHVTATSPVYLAAVLQNIASHILQTTYETTKRLKRITITVRHLFLTVANQPETQSFLQSLGVVFLEGGVNPEKLEIKKTARKKVKKEGVTSETVSESLQETLSETSESKKKHRFRPGTRTIMRMRKLQKSGEMLMQHAPFNRLVRSTVRRYGGTMRFTADFFYTFQAVIEDKVISLMKKANKLAEHAQRETVYSKDIELVCSLTGEKLGKFEMVPEATLRKLALRAGVKRFGIDSSYSYCCYISYLLDTYLREIVLTSICQGVQTLNTRLLLAIMHLHGIRPTIIAKKRKGTKRGSSSSRSASRSTTQSTDTLPGILRPKMDEPELSDVEEVSEDS